MAEFRRHTYREFLQGARSGIEESMKTLRHNVDEAVGYGLENAEVYLYRFPELTAPLWTAVYVAGLERGMDVEPYGRDSLVKDDLRKAYQRYRPELVSDLMSSEEMDEMHADMRRVRRALLQEPV